MCRCRFRTKKRRNNPYVFDPQFGTRWWRQTSLVHVHTLPVPIEHRLRLTNSFSSYRVGSWLYRDPQIPPTAAISMDTSLRRNWGTKSVVKFVRRLRRQVSQIRKAGPSALHPPSWSWMEMASQGPFNMNTGLVPTLWPSRELPGICCKQMSTWKWHNVWNAIFPLCFMRGADPPPPPPLLCVETAQS